jgi:hypothetical protein
MAATVSDNVGPRSALGRRFDSDGRFRTRVRKFQRLRHDVSQDAWKAAAKISRRPHTRNREIAIERGSHQAGTGAFELNRRCRVGGEIFFDTSVLVAASERSHPHHAQAWPALRRVANQGFMSVHSIAETYAALT